MGGCEGGEGGGGEGERVRTWRAVAMVRGGHGAGLGDLQHARPDGPDGTAGVFRSLMNCSAAGLEDGCGCALPERERAALPRYRDRRLPRLLKIAGSGHVEYSRRTHLQREEGPVLRFRKGPGAGQNCP